MGNIGALYIDLEPILRSVLGEDADLAIFVINMGSLEVAAGMLGLTPDQTEAAISRIRLKLESCGKKAG